MLRAIFQPIIRSPKLTNARCSCGTLRTLASVVPLGTLHPPPSAAALIIGNEVLSGKIQDTNTASLARLLHARGVNLVRVVVVPDVKEDIASNVLRLRELVGPSGFVFTSGGIGPTHDDITYESIAGALGRDVEIHKGTHQRMREFYEAQGKEVNASRLRMATIPVGSEVLTTPGVWVPLVRIENIYILPGIPRLFNAMMDANKSRFTGPDIQLETILTLQGEGEIAEALREIALNFPEVQIGSYPKTTEEQKYTTKLTFESRDSALVSQAVAAARRVITVLKE